MCSSSCPPRYHRAIRSELEPMVAGAGVSPTAPLRRRLQHVAHRRALAPPPRWHDDVCVKRTVFLLMLSFGCAPSIPPSSRVTMTAGGVLLIAVAIFWGSHLNANVLFEALCLSYPCYARTLCLLFSIYSGPSDYRCTFIIVIIVGALFLYKHECVWCLLRNYIVSLWAHVSILVLPLCPLYIIVMWCGSLFLF